MEPINNNIINIWNAYYKSKADDPSSILYKRQNKYCIIESMCKCCQLVSYISDRVHYSGNGGSHRTLVLDQAERELESCMVSGKLPNNRSTYVFYSDDKGDYEKGQDIFFFPVINITELHMIMCYNYPYNIRDYLNLTYAINEAPLFETESDLTLIIGCIVDSSFFGWKRFTPRYLLAIRSPPTQIFSIVDKLGLLFVSSVMFIAGNVFYMRWLGS